VLQSFTCTGVWGAKLKPPEARRSRDTDPPMYSLHVAPVPLLWGAHAFLTEACAPILGDSKFIGLLKTVQILITRTMI